MVLEGVSERIHVLSRLGRAGIRMHPHIAEILAKSRIEEGAGGRVDQLARRAQDFADTAGCLGRSLPTWLDGLGLYPFASLFLLRALRARSPAGAGTLQPRLMHA